MGTAFSEPDTSNTVHVINPAQHQDIVGTVYEATTEQAEIALIQAANAQHLWANLPKNERAACLNALKKLGQMTQEQQAQFYANAEQWKKMSEAERTAWRKVVIEFPPLPPDAGPQPPLPPGFPEARR